MRKCNDVEIIRLFQEKGINLFTLTDFAKLFEIANKQTLYKKIQRLEQKKIISKLIKGKYLFLFGKADKFEIANFLRQPSYVSLESALSFYGIITGFPYKITSITIKKTKNIAVEEREYQYTQITNNLFWGWEKREDFLLADKEKSLIDYLYLSFKGLRVFDKQEFDLKQIDYKKLNKYFKIIKNKSLLKFLKKLEYD